MNFKVFFYAICGITLFNFTISLAKTFQKRELDIVTNPQPSDTAYTYEETRICGDEPSTPKTIFLTANDCGKYFKFEEIDKTCNLHLADDNDFDDYYKEKGCLYASLEENNCPNFRFPDNCNEATIYVLLPEARCVQNSNQDIIIKRVNPMSLFVNKQINTKDYFFVVEKKILTVNIYIHFNINRKKIENLEKLMQNILTRVNITFEFINNYTRTCDNIPLIEIHKWCVRKAIQDYYHYADYFEDNIRKIKFGKRDINDIMKEIKSYKLETEDSTSNINLFIESYNGIIRTFEPEMQIYYQEINQKITVN